MIPSDNNKALVKWRRRTLKEGTTAVLIANGYKWRCPNCDHDNYNQRAKEAVDCKHCFSYYGVQLVFHTRDDQPISPGSMPASLYRPSKNSLQDKETQDEDAQDEIAASLMLTNGDITMTVTGYSWRCPECGTSGYRKHVAFTDVTCGKCFSQYAISEIRHRLTESELSFGQYPGALWQMENEDNADKGEEEGANEANAAEMPEDISGFSFV